MCSGVHDARPVTQLALKVSVSWKRGLDSLAHRFSPECEKWREGRQNDISSVLRPSEGPLHRMERLSTSLAGNKAKSVERKTPTDDGNDQSRDRERIICPAVEP